MVPWAQGDSEELSFATKRRKTEGKALFVAAVLVAIAVLVAVTACVAIAITVLVMALLAAGTFATTARDGAEEIIYLP